MFGGDGTFTIVTSAVGLPVDVLAIAAGDNNIGNVDIVSGVITTVSALGVSTTGPQKAEDVASAAGDMGIAVFAIRDDTLDARSGTEGDYEFFHTDANGALWVHHTADSVAVTNAGLTELAAAINASSQMDVNIAASAATLTVASHAVTNAGTFATQVDGAALTALQLIDNLVLAEDAVHGTGDPGVQMLAVRQDVQADFAADGDYVPLSIDANGALRVAGGGGGTEYAVDDALGATPTGKLSLAIRDDALSALTPVEGDAIGLRVDANGALWVIPSGTVTVASHAVTNAGTFATQVDGAALTALQLIDDTVFAEDVAAQAADKGVAILAVRRDADTSLVGTDNDYANLQVNNLGALKVEAFSGETLPVSLATVPSHAVTNAGTFAVQVDGAALTALQLIDDAIFAEDAAASSGEKGISNLAVRVDTPNVALTGTDADYGHMTINKLGSLRTAYPEDDLATAATKHTYKYYTNAGAVTDGIIWSPAAGARWFLTSLTINISAAATVTIEDDVAAGDVVRFKFELAANSGVSIPLNPPMFSGEDAADLLVTTTAGNVYITAVGYEI